ncbi:PREDICTED: uncharacterized protein LOC105954308 [Erythranthe guttata]|uniref:uncharacterized protein LOC105954308 n=1 Tax=Erythranthe guttata TaxID=4155 RepID=UPI00064D73CF|nr:PREDICTED: uncharacterized protein LOC105954308 [Erythranthe guttata]|eukprot:XP_012833436.1 PREDICTED: uncharacterized protein LOC105954308 [Erythranthe guttata]
MEVKYKQRKDWYEHGEHITNEDKVDEIINNDAFNLYRATHFLDKDYMEPNQFVNQNCNEPMEGKHDDVFIEKLKDAETPLYSNGSRHNKLSAIVALFQLKIRNGWSDRSFNDLLDTLSELLPEDNVLPKSLYLMKKFLKEFDMGYEKIHACLNDCCLFRKEYEDMDNCPKCGDSRWKMNKRSKVVKKGVPAKVLRYFPIIPRFRRLFKSEKMAADLRWHFNNKSNDGKMHHPVDSVTWDLVNDKWESFAIEPRNLRLGLSTDGFNPFCPKQPGNDIDVYLQPLIDDLKVLWHNGVEAYDAFSKTIFNLRAILLWTISDFPAYGNLAGCCTKENGMKPRILTGRNIFAALENFQNNFGKDDDQDELGRWKKRSIFFDLPYWKELPLPHNLDVMHVEKNICESIISTILHCGKSKDGINARKDLEDIQIRKDLYPQPRGSRTYLPPAPWTLSRSEKNKFCKRLYDFKGPDGYCSNIGKCVSLEDCKVIGLKSHDYHVLMQQLLPVALRGLLPKGPRKAVHRLSIFFHKLCQRVIDREKIAVIEDEVIETLCMLERHFPPSFFDIMVHLVVHLGREARLCGPVHFRWMYPFERYMKILKDYVRNSAQPEGCIAESYLAEECVRFCSEFLKNSVKVEEKDVRNDDCGSEIPIDSEDHSNTLKWIAYGPRDNALSYTGYIINGLRFHTKDVHRETQNSGVIYEATSMCRSSAKDTAQVADLVTYYGLITDIILLDYHIFYVPIFRCHWANKGNGVKFEDGFTLVNLNQSQASFTKDPYILASQAKQIFYSRDDDSSNWYVVLKAPPRGFHELEAIIEDDENVDVNVIAPIEVDVEFDESNDEVRYVREDCEGILE